MRKISLIIFIGFITAGILTAQVKDTLIIPPPVPKLPKVFSPKNFLNIFKMNSGQEKEALKNLPDEARRMLEELKKTNPKSYYKILWKSKFRFFNFPKFKWFAALDSNEGNESEKINELELETEILGAEFKSAKEKKKEKIREKLLGKLSRLFDLKEEKRKRELNDLKNKISELKKSIEKRIKNKDLIIQRRLEELTGEEDYLKWDE